MENNLLAFAEKLKQDPGLQMQILDAVKALPEGLSDEEKVNRAVLPAAREAGFDFSYADCLALKERLKAAGDGEAVPEDELRQTAGGAWGLGFAYCTSYGGGLGGGYSSGGWTVCIVYGFGTEGNRAVCLGYGDSSGD